MTTLHLGVKDIPYAYSQAQGKGKRRKVVLSVTTGEVAELLEAKYEIMSRFFDRHSDDVAKLLASSVAQAIESVTSGADPRTFDATGAATNEIDVMFKNFITLGEVETIGIPGVPTEAALGGVSHRKKRPYAKRDRRPSFVDTGLYVNSFVSWID